MADVKKMDYACLRGNVTETRTKRLPGGWYWQPGVVGRLFKDYDHFILLGESRALSTWAFCILARLLKPKKKVYFWSHGWYGKETGLENLIKKILFKLPNGGIFTYGDYARQLMIRTGFNAEKVYPIHNSLAYDEQLIIRGSIVMDYVYEKHFGNKNPNLIFVGRLTPVKRLDLILEALSICNKQGEYFNLTFVGDGAERTNLESAVHQMGITDQIWFYGASYDEREIGELFFNADICVAPGNIGLTAMHSMVYGTPCITHDDFSYQMPEFEVIEDGKTGAFFKRDDVNSLAEQIINWLNGAGKNRESVRRNCMKVIDEAWNPHYQISLLKEVLGE